MSLKINFNILDLNIDLSHIISSGRMEWWFNNRLPKIPLDTKIEDLTNDQKISLVKLAIYEGFLDTEELCNLPHKSFKIN